MKRTKIVPEVRIENGIAIQVYPTIMPTIAQRQSSFGGHFRTRSAQLDIIERSGGVKCVTFHHKKDR